MKHIEFVIRSTLAVLAALAAISFSPGIQAQTVNINGVVTSCTAGTTSMSVDPSGNISINCTVVSSGSGGGVFSCSASANPNSITSGSSSTPTISVTCLNGTGTSTYAWSVPTLPAGVTPPVPTSASQSFTVGPFPSSSSNASYSFGVTVTNGTATDSPTAVLSVLAAASTPPPSGCTTIPGQTSGYPLDWTAYGGNNVPRDLVTIPRAGYVSYKLPVVTAGSSLYNHTYYQLVSTESTASGSIMTEFAISTCPGDFSQPNCSAISPSSQVSLNGLESSIYPGNCQMAAGTQYYLNVRNVQPDGVTGSCPYSSCSLYVSMHTNPF